MQWYIWIIGIILLIIILLLVDNYFECRSIVINEVTVNHEMIPTDFDGTSFVFISDLHNTVFGKNNDSLLRKIKDIKPEFLILGGDMIVGKEGARNHIAKDFINKISDDISVYYGIGNHEMRVLLAPKKFEGAWEDYYNELNNITWMKDNTLKIKKNNQVIKLIGLDLDAKYYKRFKLSKMDDQYLNKKLGESSKFNFNILIAHNPEYFKEYSDYGANLVLSGHIHGGIIRLPFFGGIISPRLIPFPKYDKGVFNFDNNIMILSSGLGTHSIKLRINNRPEIVKVILKSKNVNN